MEKTEESDLQAYRDIRGRSSGYSEGDISLNSNSKTIRHKHALHVTSIDFTHVQRTKDHGTPEKDANEIYVAGHATNSSKHKHPPTRKKTSKKGRNGPRQIRFEFGDSFARCRRDISSNILLSAAFSSKHILRHICPLLSLEHIDK